MENQQIITEEKVLNVLKKFLESRIDNPEEELNKFTIQELSLKIRYNKYESSINAPSAKLIVDFQNSIYKIAALMTKGRPDARLLTKEEKEELEIPFKISRGSTIEETAPQLLEKIGELIKMIPENQRAFVLIAIILIIFGYLAYNKFINYKKFKEEKDSLNEQNKSKDEIIKLAMDKLEEENEILANIVVETEKDALNNLSNIGSDVEYQGQQLSAENINQIKKERFPTAKQEPKANHISGNYRIVAINLKQNNIIVDPINSQDSQPLKLYYDNNDLLAYMQNLKEKLKTAIDNEEKVFNIEAIRSENGNKIMYSLYSIKEV